MTQNTQARIAVLEDENGLRNDLIEYLQLSGFIADGFACAEDLFADYPAKVFDLAIIDIGLPGINGLYAAQWLRSRSPLGIVILTALGSPSDQVAGLEKGADAYLVKNTPLEVIAATCRSVLRRIGGMQATDQNKLSENLPVNDHLWRLSYREWSLTLPTGDKVRLTHTETMFLQCLIRQPGIPVNRVDILSAMGKIHSLANLRNLDNCSSRLRNKIEEKFGLDIPVRPSYGSGYTFAGKGEIEDA
jgi:DNA-binding response OmpR family regulator